MISQDKITYLKGYPFNSFIFSKGFGDNVKLLFKSKPNKKYKFIFLKINFNDKLNIKIIESGLYPLKKN